MGFMSEIQEEFASEQECQCERDVYNRAIDQVLERLEILKNDNETAIKTLTDVHTELDMAEGVRGANNNLIKAIAEITRLKV